MPPPNPNPTSNVQLYRQNCRQPSFNSADHLPELAARNHCHDFCSCYGGPPQNFDANPNGPAAKGPLISEALFFRAITPLGQQPPLQGNPFSMIFTDPSSPMSIDSLSSPRAGSSTRGSSPPLSNSTGTGPSESDPNRLSPGASSSSGNLQLLGSSPPTRLHSIPEEPPS